MSESRVGAARWHLLLAAGFVCTAAAGAADWPGWLGPQRDGVWRETGIVEKFPSGGPKVLWRAPVADGYSGPAVADGRVYVMDRRRVRGPDGKPLRPTRKGILGDERVLCLDAATGKVLWDHTYDCPYKVSYPLGPRTTPAVRAGHVYTLGAMGKLLCLDAASGKVVWAKDLVAEYKLDGPPVWGYAASPLLDGDLLVCQVGGPGSAVVAFRQDTGKEVWRALTSEEVGYSPAVICQAGGRRQLIVWLSESVNGLDPATGKVYWTQKFPADVPPQRPAVNIAMPRCHGNRLFVTNYYHGSLMLELEADKPGARVLWQKTVRNPTRPEGLNGALTTPVFKDGFVYGVAGFGDLCCVEADTGKLRWRTLKATGERGDCATVFIVPQDDRFFLYNDQGDLIIARLSPGGYEEVSRTHVLDADQEARGRKAVWSHPAFAHRCLFARNSKELVCVSLAAQETQGAKP
jgi:outer membrane protein assembly factor BamB